MFTILDTMQQINASLTESISILSSDVVNKTTSVFTEIEQGMTEIIDATLADIKGSIFRNIKVWKSTYSTTLQEARDALVYIIGEEYAILNVALQTLRWDSTGLNVTDDKFSYVALQHILEELIRKVTVSAVSMRKFVAFHRSVMCVDDEIFKWELNEVLLPKHLVYGKSNETYCTNTFFVALEEKWTIINDTRILLDDIGSYLLERSENLPPLISITQHSKLAEYVDRSSNFKETAELLQDCLTDYTDYLNDIEIWLSALTFPFYQYSSTVSVEEDVTLFRGYYTQFGAMVQDFTKNVIDVFELTELFQKSQFRDATIDLENVRTKIQQDLSIPTKTTLTNLENILRDYYMVALRYIVKLSDYFEEKEEDILYPARYLQIWREPIVNFDNQQIMSYQKSVLEGERGVPANLHTYIEEEAEIDLSFYLRQYFAGLEEAVDNFDGSLLVESTLMKEAFADMDNLLRDFQTSSTIGDEFVQ